MTKENSPLRPNGWWDEWRTFNPNMPGVSPFGRRWPEQRAEGAPGTDSYPGIPTMVELPLLIGMVFDLPGTLYCRHTRVRKSTLYSLVCLWFFFFFPF